MLVLAFLRTGIFTVECACPEPFRTLPHPLYTMTFLYGKYIFKIYVKAEQRSEHMESLDRAVPRGKCGRINQWS
jgi:hypothetical protein